MKIVFMGTPDFAAGVLEALINSEHEITAVITQPDRPKGRSRELIFTPVKELACKNGIEVFQPNRIKDAEAVEQLRKYEADIYVVAAFGQILSKEILDIPKFGCINVHASLLPKYRGAAPIQWCIADGEEYTGVTIMQMNEGLDTGDILTQEKVDITSDETGETLFDKLMEVGSKLLVDTLSKIQSGDITPTPQKDEESSYAVMIKKEMGHIDYKKSAVAIERLQRAFTPWPGVYSFIDGKMLKLKKVSVSDKKSRSECGVIEEVRKDSIIVACAEGSLVIEEVQLEGKKAMNVHDFLLGYKIEPGDILL